MRALLFALALLGPLAAQADTRVIMDTSEGQVVIALEDEKAPNTVANFLTYVDDKFYDGTVFHRVIPRFMIQGGGFTKGDRGYLQKDTRASIDNEADNGLRNQRGTLAMARTNDPHSATAQFFINTVDNRALDFRAKSGPGWGYTVFGRVVEGMDVVDRISAAPTGRGMLEGYPTGDVPMRAIEIRSIRRDSAAIESAQVADESTQ